jgi:hypothetical protein
MKGLVAALQNDVETACKPFHRGIHYSEIFQYAIDSICKNGKYCPIAASKFLSKFSIFMWVLDIMLKIEKVVDSLMEFFGRLVDTHMK